MSTATAMRLPRPTLPRSSTPDRLRILAVAAIAACIGVTIFITIAISTARTGLRVIGDQTGPVVISSSNLYFALSDMDAQVANVLLVADRTDLGLSRQQAEAIYTQRRDEANQYLLQTAAVSGNDPAAAAQLRQVLDTFGTYESLAGQAILLEAGSAAQAGQPPAAALTLYRQATDLMHGQLLPAARTLIATNAAVLGQAYDAAHDSTSQSVYWVVLLGAVALALLVLTQVYLARRVRRRVNPAFAVATLVMLGTVVSATVVLSSETEHLRGAKKDAFDSVLALSQARAISYDANADESRYLLDPDRADQYQQAFLAKTQQLAEFTGATIGTWDQSYADALTAYHAGRPVTFNGFLGTEMRNITFVGERAAAEKVLASYQIYQRDDRHIRALVHAGNMPEAIRFCTSFAAGDSNDAFDHYDQAMTALIGINVQAFGDIVNEGERMLDLWPVLPWVLTVITAGLVIVGLRPRLAEYR
jgi:hypothetical protein